MVPLGLNLAFVAAAVVLSGSHCAQASHIPGPQGGGNSDLILPGGYGGDGFASFFERMTGLDRSELAMFGGSGLGFGPSALSKTSVRLSLAGGPDAENCKVALEFGADALISELRVVLDAGRRTLTASFKQEKRNDEEQEKGGVKSFRVSSSVVSASSSVRLPERCLASSAVVLSGLCGVLTNFEDALENKTHKAFVLFPSTPQLRALITEGSLPATALDSVANGDPEGLAKLTHRERCLAAGFSADDCAKLGNRQPALTEIPAFATPSAIPLPHYKVSLSRLDE